MFVTAVSRSPLYDAWELSGRREDLRRRGSRTLDNALNGYQLSEFCSEFTPNCSLNITGRLIGASSATCSQNLWTHLYSLFVSSMPLHNYPVRVFSNLSIHPALLKPRQSCLPLPSLKRHPANQTRSERNLKSITPNGHAKSLDPQAKSHPSMACLLLLQVGRSRKGKSMRIASHGYRKLSTKITGR